METKEIAILILGALFWIVVAILRSIVRDKERKVEEKKKELQALKDKWKQSSRKL